MKYRYWVAAAALSSLVLGACQPTAAPDINVSRQAGDEVQDRSAAIDELGNQEPGVLPTAQESEASIQAAETQEDPAPIEVRQGLAATDPATVNLASGSPTFVEFFAFW